MSNTQQAPPIPEARAAQAAALAGIGDSSCPALAGSLCHHAAVQTGQREEWQHTVAGLQCHGTLSEVARAADVHDAEGPLPKWVLLPQQQRHHPLPAWAVLQMVDQGAQGAFSDWPLWLLIPRLSPESA